MRCANPHPPDPWDIIINVCFKPLGFDVICQSTIATGYISISAKVFCARGKISILMVQ